MSRHVYGPVPSRRLGRSLGIDLVPFKVCTYDCVYCQLGRTTNLTVERGSYVPLEILRREIDEALASGPPLDFIGLAGSGEPTLHAEIGVLIRDLKKRTSIPVAVLTNGALLGLPEVRESLAAADLVLPSLDAGCAARFAAVNRPHPEIGYDTMVEGLHLFTRGFKGEVWLEIMVLSDIFEIPGEVDLLAGHLETIMPSRVQLNTVTRPPGAGEVRRLDHAGMEAVAQCLPGRVEIIADIERPPPEQGISGTSPDTIIALLRRRPCTLADIAIGLGIPVNEVLKLLERLTADDRVRTSLIDDRTYYRVD